MWMCVCVCNRINSSVQGIPYFLQCALPKEVCYGLGLFSLYTFLNICIYLLFSFSIFYGRKTGECICLLSE